MAPLDLAEGPRRGARRHRRVHHPGRRHDRRGLRGDAGPHRGDGRHRLRAVRRLLQRRRADRAVRQHRPADADLQPAPAGARHHQRGAGRGGPPLLDRGRRLAHGHRAGRPRGPHRQRRLASGRFDHHAAVRQELLPGHRHSADGQPQDQGDLRGDEGRQGEVQAVDPDQLPQHDLPGSGRLRRAGRGRDVLRQAGGRAQRGAGRGHRRPDPAAEHVPAAPVPSRADGPVGLRGRRHGADGEPVRAAGRDAEVPRLRRPRAADRRHRRLGPVHPEHGPYRAGEHVSLQRGADR